MRDPIPDPHPAYTAEMMADLTGQPTSDATGVYRETSDASHIWHDQQTSASDGAAKALGEPVGGDSGPGRSVVYPARNGPQRASYEPGPVTIAAMERARRGEHDGTPADWIGCWIEVSNAYARAARILAAAPSIPLAGTEAWAEADGAYRARLTPTGKRPILTRDRDLDIAGEMLGLPRARLVRAEA